MRAVASLLVSVLLLTGCTVSYFLPSQEPGEIAASFEGTYTEPVAASYYVHVPESYAQDSDPVPLMLFLHGAGERGDDLTKVKGHGPPKLASQDASFPFLVVSPQVPENQWHDPETLITLIDQVASDYNVDEDRIYLTGLSMGGHGTWQLAGRFPDRFAAIVPICGWGSRYEARSIARAKLPTWVFHGAQDRVVLLRESEHMVEMMQRAGLDPKFTVYPDAGHDAWTPTYDNPELYEWLLSHRRSDRD
ncbi:MAG: prolyl oligopeptidase family serine peptidase [Bacteroidota bacterium]